jgi:hypothetical protein
MNSLPPRLCPIFFGVLGVGRPGDTGGVEGEAAEATPAGLNEKSGKAFVDFRAPEAGPLRGKVLLFIVCNDLGRLLEEDAFAFDSVSGEGRGKTKSGLGSISTWPCRPVAYNGAPILDSSDWRWEGCVGG